MSDENAIRIESTPDVIAALKEAVANLGRDDARVVQGEPSHAWVVALFDANDGHVTVTCEGAFVSKPTHDDMRRMGRRHELQLVADDEHSLEFKKRGCSYSGIIASRVELKP